MSEQFTSNNSSIESSSSEFLKRKTARQKSSGNIIKYVYKLKENYEESQAKLCERHENLLKI